MKDRKTDLFIIRKYLNQHGDLVAGYLEGRSSKEIADFVESMPLEITTGVISLLSRIKAAECLKLISTEHAKKIMEKIEPLKADVLLRNLDEQSRESILNVLTPELSEHLHQTLSYPKDAVGANMETNIFTLPASITVREALKRIKKSDMTTLPFVFVLNQDETLAGIVEFRTLILTELSERLTECVDKAIPRIFDQLNTTSVVENEGWMNYKVLPVVNQKDVFLGTIRLENMIDMVDVERKRFAQHARVASSALGDLYKIGLGSFFRLVDEGWKEDKRG